MTNQTGKIARIGMLLAFALLLSYVETLLPLPFAVPGMKLGLANLAVVLAMYLIGGREAFLINVLRIILNGFLFGNLYSIIYSLAGGLFSFFIMLILKYSRKLSIVGVSMAGGVFHNVGQLLVAVLIVSTGGIFYYLPVLMITGVLTGFLIGILSVQVMKRVDCTGQ